MKVAEEDFFCELLGHHRLITPPNPLTLREGFFPLDVRGIEGFFYRNYYLNIGKSKPHKYRIPS